MIPDEVRITLSNLEVTVTQIADRLARLEILLEKIAQGMGIAIHG